MELYNLIKSSPSNFFTIIITLLILISPAHTTSTSSTPPQTNTNFIKTSCNATTYPRLCLKTLTPYASTITTNPLNLCNMALTIAAQATTNCSATVLKIANKKGLTRPDARAIRDCIGDMKDAVYELGETVNATRHLGMADREFQWANAKTYASAAITDADTCVDGVLEGNMDPVVKKKIRNCVSGVEQLISIALTLINHLY